MPSFFRAKGVLILMLISVPMAIIALLVKFTSPGPIFFVQRRYGLHGNEVPVIKLRSMGVMEDGDDVTQVKVGDMRVRPLGAFLRGTSLGWIRSVHVWSERNPHMPTRAPDVRAGLVFRFSARDTRARAAQK